MKHNVKIFILFIADHSSDNLKTEFNNFKELDPGMAKEGNLQFYILKPNLSKIR